jgi:hypothetical protein
VCLVRIECLCAQTLLFILECYDSFVKLKGVGDAAVPGRAGARDVCEKVTILGLVSMWREVALECLIVREGTRHVLNLLLDLDGRHISVTLLGKFLLFLLR